MRFIIISLYHTRNNKCSFFRISDKDLSECRDDEFDCDDDTCIAKDLECNMRNNCKFLKDEAECKVNLKRSQSEQKIALTILFTVQ